MNRIIKSNAPSQKGFTMVEMITVLIVVGIMAAVAAPRFFDSSAYQNRGAYDQVKAALRYGQKVAVAERHNVSVAISQSASPTCNITVSAYSVTCQISTSVQLSAPLTETFNSLGQPSTATSINVGGTTITIEQETGYVH